MLKSMKEKQLLLWKQKYDKKINKEILLKIKQKD